MLRHPIDRLVSHYVHGVAAGRETRSLAALLAAHDANTRNAIDTGRYYWQLEPYLARVSRDRIWFGTNAELASDHDGTMQSVFTFLGLEPDRYTGNSDQQFNTGARKVSRRRIPLVGRFMRAPVRVPQVAPAERAMLMSEFAPDIARLETVVGRSLGWT
jgi:hypothetical protein